MDFTEKEKQKGVICVFISAFLYSIGGLCIKVIPWNGVSINSARTMIACVVLLTYFKITKHKIRFNRMVLLGAVCVCLTNTLFTMANKMTTAANTIVLQFTAPIFVILLGIVFWHKKPKKLDIAACIFVLAGVVCFFVDSLSAGNMAGNILALVSGLTYAGVFLMSEMPGNDPISAVFFGDVLSVLVGLPFLIKETEFTRVGMISLLILGVFQVAFAYILMCIGLRTTPAITASLISGIEPILNPIWVALFYGETIGTLSMIGAVLVIVSVVGYNVLLGKSS